MTPYPLVTMTFRIFVAFDMDHDQDLCDHVHASSGSQWLYEVCGRSETGAMGVPWQRRTKNRGSRAAAGNCWTLLG